MIIYPNAKINLGLNVVSRRSDGYHNLETIFYPIPLTDRLEVVTAPHEITESYTLLTTGLQVDGTPSDNLIIKALQLLKADYDLPSLNINLHKQIPTEAGLGGGSANCAFMIRLLNTQYHLHMTDEQMEAYAARLGADCAFFIRNRPVLATGIGNVFHPTALSLQGYHLLLIKPDIRVSTRVAFGNLTPRQPEVRLADIVNMPIEQWAQYMTNDFEQSVFKQYPAIKTIKEQLYECGAVYASMSGSGSSVYGLFTQPVSSPTQIFGTHPLVYQMKL